MFITLNYPTHEEYIPIKSIFKFAKKKDEEVYIITLSEISTKMELFYSLAAVKNVTVEITQESQPAAYLQIQEYLKSKT
jgi:hypothetical protein